MSTLLKQTIRLVVRNEDMFLQSLPSDNFLTAEVLDLPTKDMVAVLKFAKVRDEQESVYINFEWEGEFNWGAHLAFK